MSVEASSILAQLGLSQYLDAFVDEGFDTWEALLDIQESDLSVLSTSVVSHDANNII